MNRRQFLITFVVLVVFLNGFAQAGCTNRKSDDIIESSNSDIYEDIKCGLSSASDKLKEGVSNVGESLKSGVISVHATLKDSTTKAIDVLSNAATRTGEVLRDGLSIATDAGKSSYQFVKEVFIPKSISDIREVEAVNYDVRILNSTAKEFEP